MAFNEESIYLDLKKNLHNMDYKPLTEILDSKTGVGKYSKLSTEIKHSDLGNSTYLFFEERDLVRKDIINCCLFVTNINHKSKMADFPFAKVIVRIHTIIHKYLEKPSLLDNLINEMVDCLIGTIRIFLRGYFEHYQTTGKSLYIPEEFNKLVGIFVTLDKVRGTKNLMKYLGHDVNDFEPLVFFVLSSEGKVSSDVKYFFMLWLSVVLLVPFDFKRLDSQVISKYYKESYSDKSFERVELLILDFCKRSLKNSARNGGAVARCASTLFRRPDMNSLIYFEDFFFTCLNELGSDCDSNLGTSYFGNIYHLLGSVVKNCRREFIEENYNNMMDHLINIIENKTDEVKDPTVVRHGRLRLVLKIVNKLLKPINKRWIHTHVKKHLTQTLEKRDLVPMLSNTMKTEGGKSVADEEKEDNNYTGDINNEYIEVVEKAVDFIFEGLADVNSNIRYLAAKGLALMARKLSENLSDELLQAVLEQYEYGDEYINHGVCLTIGEFCRNKILSPKFLPKVVQILKDCLIFETYEGIRSSGSFVRDAACYISWSFARFYNKKEMAPYVDQLSSSLLLTALFDKEGNCRRAAAASFQENVGRQGYFPNGIQIISEMDYFTVGNIQNAFLEIAPFVGSFKEYSTIFIDHLATNRIFHMQKEMRMLSAKSLGLLSLFSPDYVVNSVLPKLVEKAKGKVLNKRHGSIFAIGSILLCLSGNSEYLIDLDLAKETIFKKSLQINEQKLLKSGEYMTEFKKVFEGLKKKNQLGKLGDDLLKSIIDIPGFIIANKLLKGQGGEITRIALSSLIGAISKSKISLEVKTIKGYLEFIHEAFRTTIDDIQDYANETLKIFSNEYLQDNPEQFVYILDEFIKRINVEVIKDIKKSFCLGISSFPTKLLNLRKKETIDVLAANCVFNKKIPMNDPEIRSFCVLSIAECFKKLGKDLVDIEMFDQILAVLRKSINDYTVDKRGDIGLVVREEAIDSLFSLVEIIVNWYPDHKEQNYLNEKSILTVLACLLSQLVNPNNRLRVKAGSVMQKLVNKLFDKLPNFENKELMVSIFSNSVLQNKFKEHQDVYFKKYDVSLVSNKNFLAYTLNPDFIYYWDIPTCTYPHVIDLILCERFRYDFLKGLILSISVPNKDLSAIAFSSLSAVIEKDEDISGLIFKSMAKLLRVFKAKEKFFVSVLKTLKLLIKVDDFYIDEFQETIKEILDIIVMHLKKTKSINKMTIAAEVFSQLLTLYEDLDKDSYYEVYGPVLGSLLFSNYPIVRKSAVNELYMFLITAGEKVYDEDTVNELTEYLNNTEIMDDGNAMYELFKTVWKEKMDNLKK